MRGNGDASGSDQRSITVTLEPCGGLRSGADLEARVGLLDAGPSGNREPDLVERDVVDLVGETHLAHNVPLERGGKRARRTSNSDAPSSLRPLISTDSAYPGESASLFWGAAARRAEKGANG